MFVYNIKFNYKKIFKIAFTLMIIIATIFCCLAVYKVLLKNNTPSNEDTCEITTGSYTNILKSVHEDIDTYVGQKITFSGYIYRAYDFNETQFVLARDMVVSSNFQTMIVGFLCTSNESKNFKDGTWVNITGKITKGYYHGDIPIIEIEKINETEEPKDLFVYPPDDYYIPTSSLLYNKI